LPRSPTTNHLSLRPHLVPIRALPPTRSRSEGAAARSARALSLIFLVLLAGHAPHPSVPALGAGIHDLVVRHWR
jgi:hypothetical protein